MCVGSKVAYLSFLVHVFAEFSSTFYLYISRNCFGAIYEHTQQKKPDFEIFLKKNLIFKRSFHSSADEHCRRDFALLLHCGQKSFIGICFKKKCYP